MPLLVQLRERRRRRHSGGAGAPARSIDRRRR